MNKFHGLQENSFEAVPGERVAEAACERVRSAANRALVAKSLAYGRRSRRAGRVGSDTAEAHAGARAEPSGRRRRGTHRRARGTATAAAAGQLDGAH